MKIKRLKRSKSIIFVLILLSFLLSENKSETFRYGSFEVGLGTNTPTGQFDKYADDGFSIRFSFAKNIDNSDFFKWQVGAQYMQFRSDRFTDQFNMESGNPGPTVDVVNSEQAYVINGGLRLSGEDGLFNNGLFVPYIGARLGLAFFRETTRWSWNSYWSDCNIILEILLDDYDCNDSDFSYEVNDRGTEPIFSLDLGTNIYFGEDSDHGLDIGIRYNMVTGLKRPDILYYDVNDETYHSYILDKLQADYYTIYIGYTKFIY